MTVKVLNLPNNLQLDLFDKLVTPILLYGSEIWAYENNDIIEKLHLKYCKYILSVNKSTTSSMVHGELGRYPLNIEYTSRYPHLNIFKKFLKLDLRINTFRLGQMM